MFSIYDKGYITEQLDPELRQLVFYGKDFLVMDGEIRISW